MITVGPITLPRSAAELLDATDGYGAGAKLWLESSATGTGSWSAVASEVLVAGTEAIYFVDPSGTSGQHHHRIGLLLMRGLGQIEGEHQEAPHPGQQRDRDQASQHG